MDLINLTNIKLIFREFIKNPSINYVSVYLAITKNYFNNQIDDLNQYDEFEKYRTLWQTHSEVFKKGYEPYTPCHTNPGFYHVKASNYDDSQKRKHRIYINPSVKNREKFVHELIKECLNNGVSFYFKYSRGDNRTDNLLIYASDEQLGQYAQILKNIEKHHPEIICDHGLTPLSATSIGWFAYGIEDNSNEKGSLSQRVSKIVRENITKILIENRQLFDLNKIDKKSIGSLYKACIESYAEKLGSAERDVFKMSGHKSLEEAFYKNYKNIAKFVLNCKIPEEQIEENSPVMCLVDDEGTTSIEITPAAISVMLAGLKPNFSSVEQRENIYNNLQNKIVKGLKQENLYKDIPEVLQYNFTNNELV